MHICICIHMHVRICDIKVEQRMLEVIYICVCACMYVCMYVCVYVCVCVFVMGKLRSVTWSHA
jgi:hypothetical protein